MNILQHQNRDTFLGSSLISAPGERLSPREMDDYCTSFYRSFRASTSRRIFFDPSNVIFWHINCSGRPGILAR